MSFGKKSLAYQPIGSHMLPSLASHFTHVSEASLQEIFGILTDCLHTETLLFVSLIDTLNRCLEGRRDSASFGFGAGIKLSALAKDRSHKAQSFEMELLHDVLVELPMAGRNYQKLLAYLEERFGLTIALYHSCGGAIIDKRDLDAFYEACASEQESRTLLDWSGVTRKNISVDELVERYCYNQNEAATAAQLLEISLELVGNVRNELPVAA